ncbi:MAG: carboxymuconolactone decarboxylase family protein [Massilia sp.]
MSRLSTQDAAGATGPAATLYANIKRGMGMVPNAYAVIGSNSPLALEAALGLDAALTKSSLSPRDIEAVRLAVSESSGCDYCLAAHTFVSKKIGISGDAVLGLRHGNPSGDARLDAISGFARLLVTTSGTVPAEAVSAVKQAGVSDQQIVDMLLAITSITFTNLVNRVNDTPIDFPPAD